MKSIVGIGANVCDTLLTVPSYPKEDTKMRAGSITICGGGPCATGLVAASKLGETCALIGNISDDSAGKFLKSDLENYGVSTELLRVKSGCDSFTSCIWLSEKDKTRTCVFYKGNVPALTLDEQQKSAIKCAKVLMVDGNDLEGAIEGAKTARENKVKVLYDAGGLYEGIERLLPLADYLIPSEEFALGHTGCKSAESAAVKLYGMYSPEVVVITQGKHGGLLYDGKDIQKYPIYPAVVVDSNGSGDVFHGAFAFAMTKGYNYYDACMFSSAVSALKCTKVGARRGVPTYDEVTKFIKECNNNETL